MTRLHVHGGNGRLGTTIVRLADEAGDFDVSVSGRNDDLVKLAAVWDVAVDVSQSEGTIGIANRCARDGIPLVIGTTGHSKTQIEQLHETSKKTAVLLTPNFSIGVNLLFWLVKRSSEILGPEFDAEIVELHHRLKKDSPSGTAKRLGEIIAKTKKLDYDQAARHGRKGLIGARTDHEIGIHAIRAGDIVGEHVVYFATAGERIELVHRVTSRDVFARGALRAARWLIGRSAGWYDMRDVLGLREHGPLNNL